MMTLAIHHYQVLLTPTDTNQSELIQDIRSMANHYTQCFNAHQFSGLPGSTLSSSMKPPEIAIAVLHKGWIPFLVPNYMCQNTEGKKPRMYRKTSNKRRVPNKRRVSIKRWGVFVKCSNKCRVSNKRRVPNKRRVFNKCRVPAAKHRCGLFLHVLSLCWSQSSAV